MIFFSHSFIFLFILKGIKILLKRTKSRCQWDVQARTLFFFLFAPDSALISVNVRHISGPKTYFYLHELIVVPE